MQKAAELCAASSGRGETAALGKQIEFGNSRRTCVAEELNHAGHGIRAVESAFGAVNNFPTLSTLSSA